MAKQHGSKTMFEQSIIYLFNDYRRDGLSIEQASAKVTKDIEDVYNKYLERQVVKPTNVLASPITKIDKALRTISEANQFSIAGQTPDGMRIQYKRALRSIEQDLLQVKEQLKG